MSVSLGGARVGLAVADPRSVGVYDDLDRLRHWLREAMREGGLGKKDPERPLADIIPSGGSVLLKPNWVLHENRSGDSMDCMITHPAFVLAVLAEVVAGGAGRVVLADAPIQSAEFAVLTPPWLRKRILEIAGSVPVDVVDLRNVIATQRLGRLSAEGGRRSAERFVLFTLGSESLLDPISHREGGFRNTSYDPRDMARVQRLGHHQFLLCREPFEVDVILNLPKLKAHAKAGITAALKNLVGVNGDKNFLPHHRIGGSSLGGDCYEGLKPAKRVAEFCLDQANKRIGRVTYLPWAVASTLLTRIHGGDLEGKWHGNDTTWRMVLDLNRLVIYGTPEGKMSSLPQRRIYTLTDALVAGQRNGPLAPEAINLGAVSFAENSAFADLLHSALMRFDWRKMPLVREAYAGMAFPLASAPAEAIAVHCRGQVLGLSEASSLYGRDFIPPDGWVGRIEQA